MQYEYLFWSMAAVVAAALAGGALCGRLGSVKRTLIGVAALAVAIFVAVLVLSRLNGFADLAAMLSIAAFMFGLVIAAAARCSRGASRCAARNAERAGRGLIPLLRSPLRRPLFVLVVLLEGVIALPGDAPAGRAGIGGGFADLLDQPGVGQQVHVMRDELQALLRGAAPGRRS